ncbi:CapA family protein [Amaricoccus solimangrovi]|uniref:CapA family protein n=1 Tax=Amaricoccus solimangrovi TaxID=2589815 RepID=UPI0015E2D02F|nr:CapA family protein [Amaricoccus solimangrovi]
MTRDMSVEIATKITAPFTVAAVGDLIMPEPLRRSDPRFEALVGHLRAADVGFANMESSLIDLPRFAGGAVAGTAAPLAMGESIRAMGVTMMSRANNHTFDCGLAGMISTDAALDALGITHAGTGANLQEARAARFRETPKGRVGLVSFYSIADTGHFGPTYARTEATARTGSIGGMPGVNPLRVTGYNVVSPDHLERMKRLAHEIYGERPGASEPAADGRPERLRFFDQWYQAGEDVGAIQFDIDPADRGAILASVRNGKIYSDFLIATIHAHQTGRFDPTLAFGKVKGMKEAIDHHPANFLAEIARASIDAGADMFVSHGVHALAGMEIYKGRPIFYGLSNFVFQFGLQYGASSDVMENWKTKNELENPASHVAILVTCHFDGGELTEVRVHPADLGGAKRPISQMGIPLVPEPEDAARILADFAAYSAPFGTHVEIESGVGVVRLGAVTRVR